MQLIGTNDQPDLPRRVSLEADAHAGFALLDILNAVIVEDFRLVSDHSVDLSRKVPLRRGTVFESWAKPPIHLPSRSTSRNSR